MKKPVKHWMDWFMVAWGESVQTNEETGETRGFLMTVVPDEDYLVSGGSIDSVDYYHRGEIFSGLIVFNHLDGRFANAWKYQNEIIQTVMFRLNQKFNFEMDGSLPHPAGYDPASKTFIFRDNDAITSGKLKEEFFHAFQDVFYSGGISQYANTGKVNIEFEAKLYKDITAPLLSGLL